MARHIKPLRAKREAIYGNHKVYGPDGVLMFRTSARKVQWYLRRKLATITGSNEITLNFVPRGRGHADDRFYLADRANCCVVCGTTNDLTRHHIVPYSYRKHFPDRFKDHNHHDIVPLCVTCHSTYNAFEARYMVRLASKHQVVGDHRPPDAVLLPRKIRAAASALINYSNVIPAPKLAILTFTIEQYLGRQPTINDLDELAKLCIPTHRGRSIQRGVAEKITDYQEFAESWRQFFMETMKPQHMPDGWSLTREFGKPA